MRCYTCDRGSDKDDIFFLVCMIHSGDIQVSRYLCAKCAQPFSILFSSEVIHEVR